MPLPTQYKHEQVEEENENGEGGDHSRDSPTEVPQISSQSIFEEGKALHDDLEVPGDHPPHAKLPMTVVVDERSLNMKIEPLLPTEHNKERREKCTREGAG